MIAAASTLATSAVVTVGRGLAPGVEFDVDDQGVTTKNPILPPIGEIILQTIAFAVIAALLWKFAGPAIKKYYASRTERIQREMDEAAAAKTEAEAEAARIRTSLGDIETEREQIRAEARAQAEVLITDGRARLDEEVAELEARAEAELASIAGRSGDELRGEITRHAARAVDVVVADSIDDDVHQRLIEDFISQVGSSGAGAAASRNGA